MIQFLHSGLQGAPTNINAAGAMCGILDACLVDGFNALAPVTVTVSAGVATLVYATPHGYTADQYLRVAGASVAQVNGDKLPTILDAQTLTIPAVGAPDGAVGGSISTRFAPLGWERVFTDVNVRVYRSPNLTGSRMFFRVQDTSTGFFSASVRGFVSMVDANTGTEPFPTVAQASSGQLFYKSDSTTPRNWVLVGDSRTAYLFTTDSTAKAYYPISFGDFNSYLPGDAFNAIATSVNGQSIDKLARSYSDYHFLPRDMTQLPTAVNVSIYGPLAANSGSVGVYPSQVSGGATFARPLHLIESPNLRGHLRGIMHVWESVTCWPFAVLTGLDGISGRVLCCMAGVSGLVAFPLDEPW